MTADEPDTTSSASAPARGSVWEVFWAFLRLGVTSFGGPIAHLGYFRDDLVARRRWMTDKAYADLVALCQFLPGPASSQVGFAMGLHRAGALGAVAAFLAFTLPSAIALVLCILWVIGIGSHSGRSRLLILGLWLVLWLVVR